MKKILVLTSKYLPNPSANGINTKYVIDELKRRNYDVTCMSVRRENESLYDVIDDTPIYRIEPSYYSKICYKESNLKKRSFSRLIYNIAHILRKIKLGILIFNFPNFDMKQANRTYKHLERLYKKYNYDCVIGVYKPYWNIAALKKFKKKYPKVLCVGYYLDLINSNKKPVLMPQSFYNWLCYKEDINTFKLLDLILMAKGGKELYSDSKYDEVRNKIHYVDFPTFIIPTNSKNDNRDSKKHKSKIILTYAGSLNKEYRNPELMLKILHKACSKVGKIELNIYGVNNCQDLFDKYNINPWFNINYHGYCSHDVVIKAMGESDILLNISNKLKNVVPSKIFELFSQGKPIINLVFEKDDITLDYFRKYPAVVNIEAWESFDNNLNKVINFINSNKSKQLNVLEIMNNFIENTPGYTVDIIEKLLYIDN